MSRLQLALNVADLDSAIAFYSKLFGAAPAKVQPGYAHFAITNPPLKLVLFEGGETGTINHLGVEHLSHESLIDEIQRIKDVGLATFDEGQVDCCYALSDKAWLTGPDATRWEIYSVLADTQPDTGPTSSAVECCVADPVSVSIGGGTTLAATGGCC